MGGVLRPPLQLSGILESPKGPFQRPNLAHTVQPVGSGVISASGFLVHAHRRIEIRLPSRARTRVFLFPLPFSFNLFGLCQHLPKSSWGKDLKALNFS